MSKLVAFFEKEISNLPENDKLAFFIRPLSNNTEVDQYLAHTRHQKIGAEKNSIYYKVLSLPLYKVIERFNLNVDISISYSMNRRTEVVFIGKKWHIIHDEYLGKAFNLFNKTLNHIKDPAIIDHFCFRYVIEQLRVNGVAVEGEIMCGIGIDKGYFEKLNKGYRSINPQPEITFVQEAFILFHEFAHILVKRNPRLITARQKQIKQFIEESSVWRFQSLGILTNKSVVESKFQSILTEEIVCDYLALKFTFDAYLDSGLLSPKEMVIALHNCLRMVRTMNLLNRLVENYSKKRVKDGEIQLDEVFIQSSIRLYAIKPMFSMILGNGAMKVECLDATDDILKNYSDNDIYFEDPIWKFKKIFDNFLKLDQSAIPKISYKDIQDVFDYIDQTFGWVPRKV